MGATMRKGLHGLAGVVLSTEVDQQNGAAWDMSLLRYGVKAIELMYLVDDVSRRAGMSGSSVYISVC
eukprot:1663239-Amphidinium_carterae.1